MTSKHPDRQQCLEIMKEYGTPPHVVRHCIGVTDCAVRIGEALNRTCGTRIAPMQDVTFKQVPSGHGHMAYEIDHDKTVIDTGKSRTFDLELTEASGLLHDMARVWDNHWDVAADYCLEHGMEDEGKVIRVHMQYNFTTDAAHLTEADLVCLGDRLILEDKYVGLDARMDYIIEKAEKNGNMKARDAINRRKEKTKVLLRDIEDRIGMSLDELLSDIGND